MSAPSNCQRVSATGCERDCSKKLAATRELLLRVRRTLIRDGAHDERKSPRSPVTNSAGKKQQPCRSADARAWKPAASATGLRVGFSVASHCRRHKGLQSLQPLPRSSEGSV